MTVLCFSLQAGPQTPPPAPAWTGMRVGVAVGGAWEEALRPAAWTRDPGTRDPGTRDTVEHGTPTPTTRYDINAQHVKIEREDNLPQRHSFSKD